jgi:pSer/pThr/pTyr-binding forkhead associated (FHA) protein
VSHIYCSQCGFQNPEAANFCANCGAPLVRGQTDQTMALTPADLEDAAAALDEVPVKGPALVVRAGGGHVGETFKPNSERTLIGRSPECDIFLDDVTVSRKHAVLVMQGDGTLTIEDQGSLNGTFVNRARIESARLEDGDELQIGKYRLNFLNR